MKHRWNGEETVLKQASNSPEKWLKQIWNGSEMDLKENRLLPANQSASSTLFDRCFSALSEPWKDHDRTVKEARWLVDSLSVLFQSSFIVFSGPFQDRFCSHSVSFQFHFNCTSALTLITTTVAHSNWYIKSARTIEIELKWNWQETERKQTQVWNRSEMVIEVCWLASSSLFLFQTCFRSVSGMFLFPISFISIVRALISVEASIH